MTGLRAVVRIAARDARRHRGRSLLLAVMIFVPVLAATAGAVLVRSSYLDPRDQMERILGGPGVQATVTRPVGSPVEQDGSGMGSYTMEGAARPVPVADSRRQVADLLGRNPGSIVPFVVSRDRFVGVDGRLTRVDLTEADLDALAPGRRFTLVDGRLPSQDDEVAVGPRLAEAARLSVGDRITWSGRTDGERTYTVTAVVADRGVGSGRAVLARPGALFDPAAVDSDVSGRFEVELLVVGGEAVGWDAVRRVNTIGGAVVSRDVIENPPPGVTVDFGSIRVDAAGVATAGAMLVLAMLQVGLLVGPAVAVGARRSERTLALVAASGGAPGQVRGVVLAGAGALGLVASAVGAGLGTAVGVGLVVWLRDRGLGDMPRADASLLDPVVLTVVGAVTAVGAAVLPARRVARLDVTTALTGRRTEQAPRLRVPLTGLALLLAGGLVAVVSAGAGRQGRTVVGLAVAEVGLLLASTALLAGTGRLAGRLPLALRFAARDATRHRTRTAPALAAALAAVAVGTAAAVYLSADQARERVEYRPQAPFGAGVVALDPHWETGTVDTRAIEEVLRRVSDVRSTAVLDAGRRTGSMGGTALQVESFRACGDGTCGSATDVLFADPDALDVVTPEPQQVRRAFAAGRVAVWDPRFVGPDGTVAVRVRQVADDGSETSSRVVRLPATLVDGQPLSYALAPRSVAREQGLDVAPLLLVARFGVVPGEPAVEDATAALREVAPDIVFTVSRPWESSTPRAVLLVELVLALLVALAGTFTAVGLAAVDARPDFGTFAAVGADPSLRRAVGAGQACVVAVPAALLGGAAGVFAGWVLYRFNGAIRSDALPAVPFDLPVGTVAALVVTVPALAALLGWASVRSRLVVVRRVAR